MPGKRRMKEAKIHRNEKWMLFVGIAFLGSSNIMSAIMALVTGTIDPVVGVLVVDAILALFIAFLRIANNWSGGSEATDDQS